MGNARDFTLQIDKWFKDECAERIRVVVQKLGLDILKRVIEKTPVNTGRLRGNWQVSIGTASAAPTGRIDKESDDTLLAGATVINGLTEAQAIYISNNLPYASRAENGHSKQAPAGMVAVTLAEVHAHFEEIIA